MSYKHVVAIARGSVALSIGIAHFDPDREDEDGRYQHQILTDADAAKEWGMAYPMGSRMMSGETKYHEELEQKLAEHVQKEKGLLLNFGYQGIMSVVDSLLSRRDAVVYDKDDHACIYDGVRMHIGPRYAFEHNDIESFKKQMEKATAKVAETGAVSWSLPKAFSGCAVSRASSRKSSLRAISMISACWSTTPTVTVR